MFDFSYEIVTCSERIRISFRTRDPKTVRYISVTLCVRMNVEDSNHVENSATNVCREEQAQRGRDRTWNRAVETQLNALHQQAVVLLDYRRGCQLKDQAVVTAAVSASVDSQTRAATLNKIVETMFDVCKVLAHSGNKKEQSLSGTPVSDRGHERGEHHWRQADELDRIDDLQYTFCRKYLAQVGPTRFDPVVCMSQQCLAENGRQSSPTQNEGACLVSGGKDILQLPSTNADMMAKDILSKATGHLMLTTVQRCLQMDLHHDLAFHNEIRCILHSNVEAPRTRCRSTRAREMTERRR